MSEKVKSEEVKDSPQPKVKVSPEERKVEKANKALLRAGEKSSKREIREAKLSKTKAGRLWCGVTQRARWPRKNKWSELAELERSAGDTAWFRRYHYRIPAVALAVLILISWLLIYVSLSHTIGGVRLNSFILENGIADGTARAVNAVGEDGSLVLRDGSTYPAGSYELKAVIQAKFGFPYYSASQKALLVPYDWANVFIGGMQIWFWALGSFLLFFVDKLFVNSRMKNKAVKGESKMKYYEAIYAYYPRSLRLVRWAIVIVMIFCIGFLLWPLI